jgi:ABC-type amino acid transport substrate-binding protein
LTVTELQVPIRGPDDLVRARLATVKSSTTEAYLIQKRINFRSVADIQDALTLLAEGAADAVVYDKPILRYLVKKNYPNELKVLRFTFEPQEYGFAIKDGKKELEEINRSLLAYTQESTWDDLIYQYLGKTR